MVACLLQRTTERVVALIGDTRLSLERLGLVRTVVPDLLNGEPASSNTTVAA
jgi:hypothetical protein